MAESEQKISPELKEIILYRIKSSKLPPNIELSIGDLTEKPMSISEVVEHVEKEDETGKQIIKMELNYLKALKEGIISKIQNG